MRDLKAQLEALEQMEYRDLKAEWSRWFHKDPPPRLSRNLLMLGIGWKVQERAFGGLSAATKRRLKSISAALRSGEEVRSDPAQRLRPGSQLVRQWHGTTHVVLVTDEGFEWNGRNWRSLSVIAREITGQRWSGPRFFGLKSPRSGGKKHEIGSTRRAGSDG